MTRQSGIGLFALIAVPADELVARLKAIDVPRRTESLDHLEEVMDAWDPDPG